MKPLLTRGVFSSTSQFSSSPTSETKVKNIYFFIKRHSLENNIPPLSFSTSTNMRNLKRSHVCVQITVAFYANKKWLIAHKCTLYNLYKIISTCIMADYHTDRIFWNTLYKIKTCLILYYKVKGVHKISSFLDF